MAIVDTIRRFENIRIRRYTDFLFLYFHLEGGSADGQGGRRNCESHMQLKNLCGGLHSDAGRVRRRAFYSAHNGRSECIAFSSGIDNIVTPNICGGSIARLCAGMFDSRVRSNEFFHQQS